MSFDSELKSWEKSQNSNGGWWMSRFRFFYPWCNIGTSQLGIHHSYNVLCRIWNLGKLFKMGDDAWATGTILSHSQWLRFVVQNSKAEKSLKILMGGDGWAGWDLSQVINCQPCPCFPISKPFLREREKKNRSYLQYSSVLLKCFEIVLKVFSGVF